MKTKLLKHQWIHMYGGQALLELEEFDVVECVNCDDPICHGWKVQRRAAPPPPQAAPAATSGRKNDRITYLCSELDTFLSGHKPHALDAIAALSLVLEQSLIRERQAPTTLVKAGQRDAEAEFFLQAIMFLSHFARTVLAAAPDVITPDVSTLVIPEGTRPV